MLSRLGRATVALGLIVAFPDALAQDAVEPALESEPIPDGGKQEGAQDRQSEAHQKEAETDGIVPALNSIEGAIRDLRVEENAVERDRQEQREVADLQAQQDMVHWAKMMFITTAVSIGLTFVSLILILGTLVYTRRATKAAMHAAEEAQKTSSAAIAANDLNREAFIAEHRPWIRVDVRIGGPLKWDVNGAVFQFGIIAENIGRAPALNVTVHGKIVLEFFPSKLVEEQYFTCNKFREDNKHMRLGLTIFPEQKAMFKNSVPVNWSYINDHVAKTKQYGDGDNVFYPYLIGCVDYQSTLGTQHQTGFIYSISRFKDESEICIFFLSEEIQADALRVTHWIRPGRID